MHVPVDAAEAAVAEGCARLGTGCLEHPEDTGRVALDFWVTPDRVAAARAALDGLGGLDEATPEDPGWQDAMRRFHTPVRVADRLLVRPPWAPAEEGLLDVVIDPGMAFGTGQHDTTRGCLELLVGLPPGPALDVGCGSGVLAIAARRLGFDPVWAVDFDADSVGATLTNAGANGVALTVARRDLTADTLPQAPTVLANLTGVLLARLAPRVSATADRAILSGRRPEDVPAVADAWAAQGLGEVDRREGAGWVTLLVERR